MYELLEGLYLNKAYLFITYIFVQVMAVLLLWLRDPIDQN